MRTKTIFSTLLLAGFTLAACADSPENVSEQASPSIVRITKDEAVRELARNGGIATTPAGKQVTLTASDLCPSPNAHMRIPEGYKAIPNAAKDGFLVVANSVEVVEEPGDGGSTGFKCSGCTNGCAPTQTGQTMSCTSGCTSCSLTGP